MNASNKNQPHDEKLKPLLAIAEQAEHSRLDILALLFGLHEYGILWLPDNRPEDEDSVVYANSLCLFKYKDHFYVSRPMVLFGMAEYTHCVAACSTIITVRSLPWVRFVTSQERGLYGKFEPQNYPEYSAERLPSDLEIIQESSIDHFKLLSINELQETFSAGLQHLMASKTGQHKKWECEVQELNYEIGEDDEDGERGEHVSLKMKLKKEAYPRFY